MTVMNCALMALGPWISKSRVALARESRVQMICTGVRATMNPGDSDTGFQDPLPRTVLSVKVHTHPRQDTLTSS